MNIQKHIHTTLDVRTSFMFHSYISRLAISCYHKIQIIPTPPIPNRLFGETHRKKNGFQTNIDHQILKFIFLGDQRWS